MDTPILSIVIANYNYGQFLGSAIQSIIDQNAGDDVELIVCDAASTDNSVEVIKKFSGGLPPNTEREAWQADARQESTESKCQSMRLISWWCSEADQGQSSAFNKGFAHARGQWLTWLNSDELYAPKVLCAVLKKIRNSPDLQWITGNDCLFDGESGRIVRISWGPHFRWRMFNKTRMCAAAFGPSSFFRKDLFYKAGGFDETLHYCMDTHLWAKFAMMGIVPGRVLRTCWLCRIQPNSKTFGRQTDETFLRKRRENEYAKASTGYEYISSWKNPWYALWMFCRVVDGSLIVRLFRRAKWIGRDVKRFWS